MVTAKQEFLKESSSGSESENGAGADREGHWSDDEGGKKHRGVRGVDCDSDSDRRGGSFCNASESEEDVGMVVKARKTVKTRKRFIPLYGYCGILWHSDREDLSSTLLDVVTRANGYPGRRECFHGMKKMTRYCNTRRLMTKHRRR